MTSDEIPGRGGDVINARTRNIGARCIKCSAFAAFERPATSEHAFGLCDLPYRQLRCENGIKPAAIRKHQPHIDHARRVQLGNSHRIQPRAASEHTVTGFRRNALAYSDVSNAFAITIPGHRFAIFPPSHPAPPGLDPTTDESEEHPRHSQRAIRTYRNASNL